MDAITEKILSRITELKGTRQQIADKANKEIYAINAVIGEFEQMLPEELREIHEVKETDNGSV